MSFSITASLPDSFRRQASSLSMAKFFQGMAGQGITVHSLDGSLLLVSFIVFASPGSQSEKGPVGRTIACSGKSLGVDKGFEPQDWMVIHLLPIMRDVSGDSAKQV